MPAHKPKPMVTVGRLFHRHKWKILLSLFSGLAVSGVVYSLKPPMYESQAQLLIRYVFDDPPAPHQNFDVRVDPQHKDEDILDSEMLVLSSYDLAAEVVEIVGPDTILAKLGGGTDKAMAALAIHRGLSVSNEPRNSNLLTVRFRHPDPAVPQLVVTHLVQGYLRRHVSLHRNPGELDQFFSKRADQLRTELSQIEEELKKLKAEALVSSNGVVVAKPTITQLTREHDRLDANYRDYTAKLEESRVRPSLDPETGNMKVVQKASPPARNVKETFILTSIAPLAGLVAGLAWAFLSEWAARQGH